MHANLPIMPTTHCSHPARFKYIDYTYSGQPFQFYVDFKYWNPFLDRMRAMVPVELFVTNFYKMYKNVGEQQQLALEHNGKEFTRVASTYAHPLDYLKEAALSRFYCESTLLTICNAALISHLIEDNDVYEVYIENAGLRRALEATDQLYHFDC